MIYMTNIYLGSGHGIDQMIMEYSIHIVIFTLWTTENRYLGEAGALDLHR